MNMIPDGFFDVIIMEHCSLVEPMKTIQGKKNIFEKYPGIWKNLLGKCNEIRNDYLLGIYYKQKNWTPLIDYDNSKDKEVFEEVKEELLYLGFKKIEYKQKKGNKYMITIYS